MIFILLFRFGYPQPVYINVVRDPVERFLSHYYFDHRDPNSGCDFYQLKEKGHGKERNMVTMMVLVFFF